MRNAAGESHVEFQLYVLTKPLILMLEREKNRFTLGLFLIKITFVKL